MFSKILHRPALAIVISLILLFLGALAIVTLPVSQFPSVAPPRVVISIAYPGASAKVLEDSVLIPLERSINGVQDMKYMISDATSAGEATIQVVFYQGTDPNEAVVNVTNRVNKVKSLLPPLVQREGVIINRVQPQMLMYVNLYSTQDDADMKFLFNYAGVNLLPEIKRIKGVGNASILGSRQYAMRVWLKPDRMRAYDVSTEQVMEALAEQSVIGSPGRLGRASGATSQSLEYVLTYQGRYKTPEQYGDIILRATEEGEILHLKDVARIELGSEFYDIYSNLDGHPSAAIVLKQSYGSNAQDVIARVKDKLDEIKAESFPPGMDYEISYDVSSFLDASIEKVLHTLIEAFLLVALVVFVFLGDWRSTLIPTLAVPVSLIGTFFFMQVLGVNINLITLFALVLAIGIVVDNAIVVVEAVHAKMHETNLSPYRATQEVLHEIAGAIIAITLVMTAVFVPVTFMTGPVGVFYRQFSITMAVAIVLSGVVALTLTPVLCAMILKRPSSEPRRRGPLGLALDTFNRGFDRVTGGYMAILRRIVPRRVVTFGVLAACGAGIYALNTQLPAGFIPNEDQGMLYAIIQTPPGSTLERTYAKTRELQEIAETIEGVQSVSALAGYEVLTEGRGSNAGTSLINLKPWSERDKTIDDIVEELEEKTREISGATIEFFGPPAVPGYGAAGGFSLRLLDKTNSGDYGRLGEVNERFMAALRERPELRGLFTFFSANYPQYELLINNRVAMQKGVSIGKALDTLSILIGSTYEQGFIRFGRFYKVYVQADAQYRRMPSDLDDLYVENEAGEMVPYSAFMSVRKKQGLNEITRYNAYPSAAIQGAPAKGFSSGDTIAAIKQVADEVLPRGYDIAWAGLSFDQAQRGNEALYIFIVVLVFVYLVLVGQYESFLLPLAVIISLPVGVLGSFLLLKLMGLENNVYAQVGLVMLVGLLGKNAILIVEFAVQKHREGRTILDAAIEGAQVRFRPILMTSFAFIAGLVPLVRATGAGAIGNRTIGASSAGGMLLGTLLGVLIVPGLYYVFGKLSENRHLIQDEHDAPLSETLEYGDK
ncbi:HAE1 family hydrophobic/amphiphilic exporter-1 [Rhodothalassium salexigens DSM 2132]|uniref:Efflux pump membrane transporter n=1 Tax=Rhodothalassium salexigens DSM 2132 TaxID=1188247 RepID=A0A4R2PIQ1_RHOSA|nr:efflux RND transporter permease subunit [Rhodothalassium salexigens]MBB4211494.1 HAE1 family hydrophobic/amphiphilic exporter-1 [Rhodothalassium salexigens DSM 2132]MBK1640016.1 hydrophobe/amphiphile efflux-1 family RND transporter [Rhodothalassium salexigens DSM 2132]TCP34574.1 HAE1 family hydrophobic/amphiphilic exporter-1 [Rhodothalassium salexigens DSM 2132]